MTTVTVLVSLSALTLRSNVDVEHVCVLTCLTTVFRLLSFVQQENWHSKFRVLHFNMDETLKSEVFAFMEVHQRDLKFVNLKEVTYFMLHNHLTHSLCIKQFHLITFS